jgi:hypothetical protein
LVQLDEHFEENDEPYFEFSMPNVASKATDSEAANAFDSPILKCSELSGLSHLESIATSSPLELKNAQTSTPTDEKEDVEFEESAPLPVPDIEEEAHIERDEEISSDEEKDLEFASFAGEVDVHRQETELSIPKVVINHAMEISEDEDEVVSVKSADSVAANLSIASSSNESFFSICGNVSPNTTNASFMSAFDSTLVEEEADEDENEPLNPIIKKRKSELFDADNMPAVETVEIDDLSSEELSPTKFWQPPALQKISAPTQPTDSDLDLRLKFKLLFVLISLVCIDFTVTCLLHLSGLAQGDLFEPLFPWTQLSLSPCQNCQLQRKNH